MQGKSHQGGACKATGKLPFACGKWQAALSLKSSFVQHIAPAKTSSYLVLRVCSHSMRFIFCFPGQSVGWRRSLCEVLLLLKGMAQTLMRRTS